MDLLQHLALGFSVALTPTNLLYALIGSLVGTRNDLAECFDLHARGLTRVVTEVRRLDDVNACFDEVLAGEVPARLVFEM